MKHKKLASWAAALLALVIICLYPCLFLFCQNAGEANAVDMLPFFGIFLGTAALGLLVTGILFRNISRSAFVTCLGMLVVINFSLLSGAVAGKLPWLSPKVLFGILLVVGLGLTALLLWKKPDMTAGCVILALAFGAMSLVSLLTAVPKLMELHRVPESQGGRVTQTLEGDQNVYYLLFDEYGGDENLSAYFDYDNSAFYEALEARGFSISHTTRNTESCWTDTLVPNLLNLAYVAEDSMPEKTRRTFLESPYLVELFRDNGYQVNLINHRAYLRIRGAQELTQGQVEDNISAYLLERSIFEKISPLRERINRKLFESYRDNYGEPLTNAITALEHSWQAAQSGPTLTVSYIQCPHAPFVYTASGDRVNPDSAWYWRDSSLYIDQLQYLNSLILSAIDEIQAGDPDAVILLLSDHGARVPLHLVEQFGGPRFDAAAETPVMQSTLCAVCVPGETLDIEGMTGINATRTALNAAFHLSLPMVEPATGYVLDEIYNAK